VYVLIPDTLVGLVCVLISATVIVLVLVHIADPQVTGIHRCRAIVFLPRRTAIRLLLTMGLLVVRIQLLSSATCVWLIRRLVQGRVVHVVLRCSCRPMLQVRKFVLEESVALGNARMHSLDIQRVTRTVRSVSRSPSQLPQYSSKDS
jgi:hypothetical protein